MRFPPPGRLTATRMWNQMLVRSRLSNRPQTQKKCQQMSTNGRHRFCVCFYGWSKADKFIAAWRAAGFRPVGHLVFRKSYASTTRFLRYQHEQAYLLAKGEPPRHHYPVPDVLEMHYQG